MNVSYIYTSLIVAMLMAILAAIAAVVYYLKNIKNKDERGYAAPLAIPAGPSALPDPEQPCWASSTDGNSICLIIAPAQ